MLLAEAGRLRAHCRDGGVLRILELEVEGRVVDATRLADVCGPGPWPLG